MKHSQFAICQLNKIAFRSVCIEKFPRLRRQLWPSELWGDGYVVGSVGDKVTAEVVQRYVEYQVKEHVSPQLHSNPLSLLLQAPLLCPDVSPTPLGL